MYRARVLVGCERTNILHKGLSHLRILYLHWGPGTKFEGHQGHNRNLQAKSREAAYKDTALRV